MNFDHDTTLTLESLVALVNTHEPRLEVDDLTTAAELDEFVATFAISGSRTGTDAELRAVRKLRAQLRGVFDLAVAGELDGVVAELNALIVEAGAVPQLVTHDGNPLHLHYTPSDAPLHHRLGAEMAICLAIVVRDSGLDRFRHCESPTCDLVFIDLSKNRSRRYCDTQCGNRQHVAAYRDRRSRSAG